MRDVPCYIEKNSNDPGAVYHKRVVDHLVHEIPQDPFSLPFPGGPTWAEGDHESYIYLDTDTPTVYRGEAFCP